MLARKMPSTGLHRHKGENCLDSGLPLKVISIKYSLPSSKIRHEYENGQLNYHCLLRLRQIWRRSASDAASANMPSWLLWCRFHYDILYYLIFSIELMLGFKISPFPRQIPHALSINSGLLLILAFLAPGHDTPGHAFSATMTAIA